MYFFCTYFDQHYLDKGLALYKSLVRHCTPFKLWILCMDETTYQTLSGMQLPHVQIISLADFENNDPLLLAAKKNRSLIEYYFTCTPSLPDYILNHVPEVDIITYLDADLYFFSSVEPVYQELGAGSVLIIEHRFPSFLDNLMIFGIYNVGLLSFRRDAIGFACIQLWRDRCLEWCYDRFENGKFADQKYLDEWPDRFSGVIVLQHKGAGLAPWNLANYVYSCRKTGLFIDEQPIIVYHFHGLNRINRWIYDANAITYKTRIPYIVKHALYLPYINEITGINRILDTRSDLSPVNVQSIRNADEKRQSLRICAYRILQKVNRPLHYLKKWLNDDLILYLR